MKTVVCPNLCLAVKQCNWLLVHLHLFIIHLADAFIQSVVFIYYGLSYFKEHVFLIDTTKEVPTQKVCNFEHSPRETKYFIIQPQMETERPKCHSVPSKLVFDILFSANSLNSYKNKVYDTSYSQRSVLFSANITYSFTRNVVLLIMATFIK